MRAGVRVEFWAKGNKELEIIVKSLSKNIEKLLKQLIAGCEIKKEEKKLNG